jgi:membrane-associated phospholipid phosphatase
MFGTLEYMFERNLLGLEHYMGQASLALALLAALITALIFGGRWFRVNLSRISAQIRRVAERIGSSESLQRLQEQYPQAWESIIRRFEPSEYLGLHLTIGLGISIGALWLFGAITEDVIHHDPLTQFDIALLEWFHAHSTATGVEVFSAISSLGSALVMTALALLVATIFAVRRSWVLFFGWVAAFGGVGVLDTLLKHLIRRPRPIYATAVLHGYSFSFPSGHAMASLVAYGLLAYLLVAFWLRGWWIRVAVISAAALLILTIGLSRLYLGVHYFSDVVGGYAAGVLWLSACITGMEITQREPKAI